MDKSDKLLVEVMQERPVLVLADESVPVEETVLVEETANAQFQALKRRLKKDKLLLDLRLMIRDYIDAMNREGYYYTNQYWELYKDIEEIIRSCP